MVPVNQQLVFFLGHQDIFDLPIHFQRPTFLAATQYAHPENLLPVGPLDPYFKKRSGIGTLLLFQVDVKSSIAVSGLDFHPDY